MPKPNSTDDTRLGLGRPLARWNSAKSGEDRSPSDASDAKQEKAPGRPSSSRGKAARRKTAGVATTAVLGGAVVTLPTLVTALKQLDGVKSLIKDLDGLLPQVWLPSIVALILVAVLLLRQVWQRRRVLRLRKQSESARTLSATEMDWVASKENNEPVKVFRRRALLRQLWGSDGWRWHEGWRGGGLRRLLGAVGQVAIRWLLGYLDDPTIEDLADDILARAAEKKWITLYDEPSLPLFDDYYRVIRTGPYEEEHSQPQAYTLSE